MNVLVVHTLYPADEGEAPEVYELPGDMETAKMAAKHIFASDLSREKAWQLVKAKTYWQADNSYGQITWNDGTVAMYDVTYTTQASDLLKRPSHEDIPIAI